MGLFVKKNNDNEQKKGSKTISFTDLVISDTKDNVVEAKKEAGKDGKVNILFVCLGNICRSAAAEAIMKKIVKDEGLDDKIHVDSAGILNYHEGEPADYRMRECGKAHGYDVDSISRPVKAIDFDNFDLIIGMDDTNIDDLKDRAQTLEHLDKIHAMREYFVKYDDTFVPDPYLGGAAGFELVIALLEDGCQNLAKQIKEKFND